MLPSIYGENMFDDFFGTGFFGSRDPLFGKNGRNLMKTDIRETDDAKSYRFAVDLPGFEKDEIHVDVIVTGFAGFGIAVPRRVLTRTRRTRMGVLSARSVTQAPVRAAFMSAT